MDVIAMIKKSSRIKYSQDTTLSEEEIIRIY